ncbi:hypothetical protein [Mesorhizobium sp.]|uniref:hypothetical protein n=1 Tax=Mesorhizobium sp. TaxID=1871066 RepID=UPI000FE90070|nr:hypothetical protein [Mesorhizobium sp.]RWD97025.1 MAG: hypothetical protein EOS40_30255 [Mesorhizobium sp.]
MPGPVEGTTVRFSALSAMGLNDFICMAQQHVRHGERQITRQHNLIARLRTKNLPTMDALRFPRLLEELQAVQRQVLSQLLWKSANSQSDSNPLSWEAPGTEGLNDWISIPDRIFQLALELQEKLKEREAEWSIVEPMNDKRH